MSDPQTTLEDALIDACAHPEPVKQSRTARLHSEGYVEVVNDFTGNVEMVMSLEAFKQWRALPRGES